MAIITDQQSRFVNHLVRGALSGTEAARRAGYAHPKNAAYALLRKPHVVEEIRKLQIRAIDVHLTSVALATLEEVLRDRECPASARVSAARTVLEIAKISKRDRFEDAYRPTQLSELKLEELERMIEADLEAMGYSGPLISSEPESG